MLRRPYCYPLGASTQWKVPNTPHTCFRKHSIFQPHKYFSHLLFVSRKPLPRRAPPATGTLSSLIPGRGFTTWGFSRHVSLRVSWPAGGATLDFLWRSRTLLLRTSEWGGEFSTLTTHSHILADSECIRFGTVHLSLRTYFGKNIEMVEFTYRPDQNLRTKLAARRCQQRKLKGDSLEHKPTLLMKPHLNSLDPDLLFRCAPNFTHS